MMSTYEQQRQEIIDLVIKASQQQLPQDQADLFARFAQRFLEVLAISDLQERSLETFAGILVTQWRFIYERAPGEAKIKVFNPSADIENWRCPHTVIIISHDDMPFLVDSIRMELDRLNYQLHFIMHLGGLKLQRDAANCISAILPTDKPAIAASTEAPLYFEIDHIAEPEIIAELVNNIKSILSDVRAAVTDWPQMLASMTACIQELEDKPPPLDQDDIKESKDFLRWLINNNFTFLGCRDYIIIGDESNRALQIVANSGLGVLHNKSANKTAQSYAVLPAQARKIALSKTILIIAKTHTKSTVHHFGYTDYIGVKRFNQKGELIGERRFIGLYTSVAYNSPTHMIPFVRHKVARILEKFNFPHDSHDGKEVVHILETLPRDDLFQASQEELRALTLGILQLQERKRLRLFVRQDAYGRYFSCLVYLPKENFTTELCAGMQEILMAAFDGCEAVSSTYFSDSVLARIHYNIHVKPLAQPVYNLAAVEQQLVVLSRSWVNILKSSLIVAYGEANGLKCFAQYSKAFPASYKEICSAEMAVTDIAKMESVFGKQEQFGLSVAQAIEGGVDIIRFKIFNVAQRIILSDVFPILENMGLRVLVERSYEIKSQHSEVMWINDFDIVSVATAGFNLEAIAEIFQDTFQQIWYHRVDNDRLNRLVFVAQLNWDEINVLRAYTKYLRQIGFTFSQFYIEQALLNNANITSQLMALFKLRFDPDYTTEQREKSGEILAKLTQDLEQVSSLDEDRILRRLLELILATIRTNFFQQVRVANQLKAKEYLAFKFNPALIADLPLPRPKIEIFVYSSRVEGVHLRGGKVARGGIRWSDRREDFRTEVLGLMKAQQVKNSLIVPVGAKGGFYPKALPQNGDKDAIYNEAVACYQIFMRGLLDLTDNIVDGKTVAPSRVVRYDEDDHYLVVAADKGTATFSDIANNISQEYGFWLGDAFASGGSAGYDHKKIGITARGAWVSVRTHLRHLDLDVDKDDFTVIGIGDMSGDVFGNGMLLSPHIKLVAAFNHAHIFLDPNPDANSSFAERQRLFAQPKSMWTDYNPALISSGGGVYQRSAKSIAISVEVRQLLGIDAEHLMPAELIKAILKAPVDLLWNGGIGTFVKASHETHLDVLDKANDMIRIDGCELRARAIVEGGNLGFTQLGRIEYAMQGGLINTDFIDNSAGVNCSDHEVNIKILLNTVVATGKLTIAERNKLLEQMTTEVAALVLYDNQQTIQLLDLEALVAQKTMGILCRFIHDLEKRGKLNRHLEFLPSDKVILERKARKEFFTRPEIAVLLAYCKLFLKEDILASDLPDDDYFSSYLLTAFPQLLQQKYLAEIKQHKLRREIIATQLSKKIVDHMAVNFIERLQSETGAGVAAIVRAYAIAATVYDLEAWLLQIATLDRIISVTMQQDMMLQLYRLVRRGTRWFLRNRQITADIAATIKEIKPLVTELQQQLPNVLPPSLKEEVAIAQHKLAVADVPADLAKMIVHCPILFTAFDIVEAARQSKAPLITVAGTYYAVGDFLNLSWLRELMGNFVAESQWAELSRAAMLDDLDFVQRRLSIKILALHHPDLAITSSIERRLLCWSKQQQDFVARWQQLVADVKAVDNVEYAAYVVLVREISAFVDTCELANAK